MASGTPIVIAHTADLHLGRRMCKRSHEGDNVRELDIYAAAQTVARYLAETVKPDVCVVAGDVWDRTDPGPQPIKHGFDFHRTLRSADIEVLVIGGNHDTLTALGRPTNLQHLERYFGCHLALDQRIVELAGAAFCCVPYRTLSTGELTAFDHPSDVPNVLVCHADADGDDLPDFATYSSIRLPRSVLFDNRTSLRLLGHVHVHQSIGENAYYSGALERLTWGEIVNDPAIYIHRLYGDGHVETETVRVADMGAAGIPRPALDLRLDCTDMAPSEAVDAAMAVIEGHTMDEHLVRLTLDDVCQDITRLHYEESLTKRAAARGAFDLKVRPRFAPVDDPTLPGRDDTDRDTPHTPGAALTDAFRQFAASRGDDDLAALGAQLIAATTGELEQ